MIQSFRNRGTEDLFEGKNTKAARRCCPVSHWKVARRKLAHLNFAVQLEDLASPPGNRLHALKGDRLGQWAIAISERFRICFYWTEKGPDQVEITDYHS